MPRNRLKKILNFFTKSQHTIAGWFGRADERSQRWLWVITNSIQKTLQPETTIMASAIAYISLFSLFPLILLSISIASFGLASYINQQTLLQSLEFVAPAIEQLLGRNIDEVIRSRGPATSLALLSLAWSASTIFYTMTNTLNGVWHIHRRRSSWKVRGLAILFVLTLIGPTLFLVSFAGSIITNLRLWLPDMVMPLSYGLSLIMTLLLDVSLFMALYTILPHGPATWRELLPGAVGAGFLWELAKRLFLHFISAYLSVTNLVYGTVTTIIAFLFWAYIGSLIFIFGAHLSVSRWNVKQGQTPPHALSL